MYPIYLHDNDDLLNFNESFLRFCRMESRYLVIWFLALQALSVHESMHVLYSFHIYRCFVRLKHFFYLKRLQFPGFLIWL